MVAMAAFMWSWPLFSQSVTIEGVGEVITVTPDKSTGLDAVYVAKTTVGMNIRYRCAGGDVVKWYSYKNLGGGYAQEVDGSYTRDGVSVLPDAAGDTGYIIEEGTRRTYIWIVDYAAHRLQLSGVEISPERECGVAYITISGMGDAIHYYSITGRQMVLPRDVEVSYHTQEWSEDDKMFATVESTKSLDYFNGKVSISPAPLCNTNFYVSGDRFLTQWGETQYAQSGVYDATSVDVRTEAEQIKDDEEISNQIGSGDGLGGSAPAEITFIAHITDAVLHKEWQFSRDASFENIQYRFSEQNLTHIFTEEGTTYVRFIGSNADGSCEAEGETYTVNIGASELLCPNAFSPGASEGVNDEWKVSYKSLLTFKCWIFDRYGTQLYYFDDPAGGWDGRYKGKFVKPGVYYYVIEATGSDGRHYKKGGDINILRYKAVRGTGAAE